MYRHATLSVAVHRANDKLQEMVVNAPVLERWKKEGAIVYRQRSVLKQT
jgi:hypothetical protein